MTDRRFLFGSAFVSTLAMAILPGPFGATQSLAAASPVIALDKDHDATVDLAEMKDGASAVFDKLENDNDKTLDRKEASGRLNKKEFKEADADHDGTLSKDEYLAYVENLFNKADTNKEGTLDAKELRSKPGKELVRLAVE